MNLCKTREKHFLHYFPKIKTPICNRQNPIANFSWLRPCKPRQQWHVPCCPDHGPLDSTNLTRSVRKKNLTWLNEYMGRARAEIFDIKSKKIRPNQTRSKYYTWKIGFYLTRPNHVLGWARAEKSNPMISFDPARTRPNPTGIALLPPHLHNIVTHRMLSFWTNSENPLVQIFGSVTPIGTKMIL
jgi:hypothetical protein